MKTVDRTCAIAYSVYLLGDKWSLLILRDAILHKKSKFKEFISSKEKIATNILSNRLKFLVEEGFLEVLDPEGFKKNKQYLATERGISALPIILELRNLNWTLLNLKSKNRLRPTEKALKSEEKRSIWSLLNR